jgi:hypothetical protein
LPLESCCDRGIGVGAGEVPADVADESGDEGKEGLAVLVGCHLWDGIGADPRGRGTQRVGALHRAAQFGPPLPPPGAPA